MCSDADSDWPVYFYSINLESQPIFNIIRLLVIKKNVF